MITKCDEIIVERSRAESIVVPATRCVICSLLVSRARASVAQRCVVWLTNGAAAKENMFDRLGKKVRPGTFGKMKAD